MMRPYCVATFTDVDTCQRIRTAMDRGVVDTAEVLDDTIRVDEEVRQVDSIEVDEATLDIIERTLDNQRETVARFFGLALTSREGPSLLRYRAGGFYRRHVDRADVPSWPEAARRQIAVVVFLNTSFSGGVLRLYSEETHDIAPQAGTLVAFPADLPHEVLRVEHGTRDTIVDWYR